MPTHSRKRVRWQPADYDAMAPVLIALNPALPKSETLISLKGSDVKYAMRALPSERRRPDLWSHHMPKVRQGFKDAFARMAAKAEPKPEPQVDDYRPQVDPAKQENAQATTETRPAPEKLQELVNKFSKEGKPASNGHVGAVLADAPVRPPVRQVQTKPVQAPTSLDAMVDSFAASLAERFAVSFSQSLAHHLREQLARELPTVARTVMAAPAVAAQPEPAEHKEPAKPKPLHIAVVGALPQQARDIEQAFPELKITCISKDVSSQQAVATAVNADKTILMTDFVGHPIHAALKNKIGEKLVRCSGSVSAVKHQIHVLKCATNH
jgi:hypothetical protein